MRLIQLTDLHIAEAGISPYDIDVRGNFIEALEQLRTISFDLLVISGDLCYDVGTLSTYQYIKETLADYGYPYTVIKATTMMQP
ncbi:MAG: hypothetical protein R2795_03820 [Saprospiraceae bacterium]